MKTKFLKKLGAVIIAIALLTATIGILTACGPEEKPTGNIVYFGGTLTGTVGTETSFSVKTATGADNITYVLKSDNLPAGLQFNAGSITGTPTASGSVTIVVTASAEGYVSMDADWIIEIVSDPNALEFASFTASNGYVGRYFTDMLAKAIGSDDSITYKKSASSTLPDGLTLDEDGFIYGTPTSNKEYIFDVIASAEGKSSATATVTLLVRRAEETSISAGTITYANKSVSGAMEGVKYTALSSAAAGVAYASASNRNAVTYTLTSGIMPEGLTLYPNGTIHGTPASRGSYTLGITASADNCPAATATITFVVSEPKLEYARYINIGTAIVDSEFSFNLGTAAAPDGVTVTYSPKETTPLPAGLSLASNGMLTGIPTASARSFSFSVIASAPGFTDTECTATIVLKDKEIVVSGGKFEAEYIDLTGVTGTGYSGSAFQEEMVQKDQINASTGKPTVGASNGYYIGYTHGQLMLTFNFNSTAAASNVKFEIGLTCEIGNVTFTPSAFAIMVNDDTMNYGSMTFSGASNEWSPAKTFNISNAVSLKEGANTVRLIVYTNTLRNGNTGGPAIDFIQFSNYGSAALSWSPCLYNTVGK